MTNYRPLVAGLHVALGVCSILPLIVLTAVFGGVWSVAAVAAHGHPHGDEAAVLLGLTLGTVIAIVAITSALMGAVGIAAGIGVWRGDRWGDLLALLVSSLHLFNLPLGTALACFTGWVLLVREPATVRALPRPVPALS